METKYITLKRANSLEESINWLSNYLGSDDTKHVVGNSVNDDDIHQEATDKLQKLALLNKERYEILTFFKNQSL